MSSSPRLRVLFTGSPLTAVLALCITVVLLIIVPDGAGQTVLQSGVPFNTFLEALTYANAYIDVPAGATSLTVTLTNGSGDLDLYLKYNIPLVGFSSPDLLSASADFRSEGPTASETITVTPSSTPPLRAGKWYVATLNLNNARTNFTLTATYQAPASTRTGNVPGTGTVPSTPAGSKPRGPIQEAPFVPSPETKHALFSGVFPAASIPGSTFSWMYGLEHGTAAGNADMYLLLELKGGPFVFLGDQLPWDAVPVYKRNFPITTGDILTVLPPVALPGGLPWGDYNFYALLVRAGNALFDPNNWVSDISIATMRFSPLSPQQEAIITNYGYPSQFVKVIRLSGGVARIDEVWAYGAAGMAVSFIDGAFIEQTPISAAGMPTQPGAYKPEDYRFDMTTQNIIAMHGQPVQTMPPSAISIPEEIVATKFFGYDGITFGFNNDQLVIVITGK